MQDLYTRASIEDTTTLGHEESSSLLSSLRLQAGDTREILDQWDILRHKALNEVVVLGICAEIDHSF